MRLACNRDAMADSAVDVAFSSEADTGLCEENASKEEHRASRPISSEAKSFKRPIGRKPTHMATGPQTGWAASRYSRRIS
jgi:hypothetical protein